MDIRDQEVDDAYHEYLWGERAPRAIARRALVRARPRQVLDVRVDPSVDPDVAR